MNNRAELRRELKAIAKENFKKQWGLSIGLPLIVAAIAIVGTLIAIPFIFAVPILYMIILFGVIIFLVLPLAVGLSLCFTKIFKDETTSINDLFSPLKVNYQRKLGGMAWYFLWIDIWAIVGIFTLFIPTVIKAISYSMTPYILADCPNVKAKDALKLSMRMTQGYKMDLFVADLSFLGWALLGGLTFNILNLVFTMPYMSTTFAGYYVRLKEKAIESGAVKKEEFYPEA